MKNLILYILVIFVIVALYGFAYASEFKSEPDGKTIFEAQKCNMCHTVETANITSKKKDALDLSNAGKELKADFIIKFLKKEEKIDDKAHKIAFKGTDEELKILSEWIESLNGEQKVEEIEMPDNK